MDPRFVFPAGCFYHSYSYCSCVCFVLVLFVAIRLRRGATLGRPWLIIGQNETCWDTFHFGNARDYYCRCRNIPAENVYLEPFLPMFLANVSCERSLRTQCCKPNLRTYILRTHISNFPCGRFFLCEPLFLGNLPFLRTNISSERFRRGLVAVAALSSGQLVRRRASGVDPEKPNEVYSFYMFLWKIFYASYLFLPFAR